MGEKIKFISKNVSENYGHINVGKMLWTTAEAATVAGVLFVGIGQANGQYASKKQASRYFAVPSESKNNAKTTRATLFHEVKTMPSGKSASDQKVDDLEKYVDKLSDSIDSSRKEILQAIKDKSASIETKVNDLPTKDWVENTFTKKIIKILCWVIGIGLTISSILVTAAVTIIIHLWK